MDSEQDFQVLYAAMSDREILHLAADGGLRPEAEAAFNEQLQLRHISLGTVHAEHERRVRADLQIRAGFNRGTFVQFYGRKFLNGADESRGIVAVTRWIALFDMPLIPIGSYRVVERKSNLQASKIVSSIDLQWDQVWAGWFRALLVFLFFMLLFLLMAAFDNYRHGKPVWTL